MHNSGVSDQRYPRCFYSGIHGSSSCPSKCIEQSGRFYGYHTLGAKFDIDSLTYRDLIQKQRQPTKYNSVYSTDLKVLKVTLPCSRL